MDKTYNNNTALVEITKEAISQFKKILQKENNNSFVRIYVESGGCSGFSYKFSIDKELNKKNDIPLFNENGKNIFVTDKISLNFIKNSSINWEESITNSQFVIDNPLAKSSCGCGSSFTT